MVKSIRVVIFALIRNGSILLEKRPIKGYLKHQYLIPGGAINHFENLEEALKREIMEELGIIPLDFNLLTEEELPGLEENITLRPFIINSWEGTIPKTVLDKEDPYPLEWIEIDKLLNIFPAIESTKKIVRDLKKYLLASRSGSKKL